MASLVAAALLWLEHRCYLRTHGYSFRRFYRERIRDWTPGFPRSPAVAPETLPPLLPRREPVAFGRRDLRARW
ncbi:MAG TPA: hypothetical protein VGL97_20410 [Bryobacteraceae bacterium]